MKPLLTSLLLFMAVLAHADGPLTSEMQTYRVSQEANGKEVLEPTRQAQPGDVIEYRLIYENVSDKPLAGLVITGPVPANTEYLDNSNRTRTAARFVVSVDNGTRFQSEPVKRVVTGADGERHEVVVPPGEYTHVRWRPTQPIQPGQTEVFRYRVTVQ